MYHERLGVIVNKYLVTWFDNAWHNGTFYGRNVRDVIHQCKDIHIRPKKIELLDY